MTSYWRFVFGGNRKGIEALAKPIFVRGVSPFNGSGTAAPFNGCGTAAYKETFVSLRVFMAEHCR